MEFNPYKVLKVDPSADEEVISAAYRALSKKYHPDLNKSPEAQSQMQAVNQAYNLLRDAASRAKIDAQLSKENKPVDNNAHYRNPGSYHAPAPAAYSPAYGNRRSANEPTNKTQERIRVAQPGPDTFYLYQKRLVDEIQKKMLRVAVYHDKLFGKICNINSVAPDAKGQAASGSAFLEALAMFDLTDAINEALAAIEKAIDSIEVNFDHQVYYRRKINGLNSSYIAIEVIKPNRADSKEVILMIGERRGEGVASSQTGKQLKQMERIFTEAFAAMR